MKRLGLGALVLTMGLLGGCKGTRDAMINQATDTPDFQQKLVDKTRESCVSAANEKVPNRTPKAETIITSYCDCFAKKSMGSFTHAELVDLGIKGIGSMTPAEKAKMDGAVKACQSEMSVK